MFYKFELFLVIQKKKKKKDHKYKFIQTFSSPNFIYRVRYIIRFFMVYLYYIACNLMHIHAYT